LLTYLSCSPSQVYLIRFCEFKVCGWSFKHENFEACGKEKGNIESNVTTITSLRFLECTWFSLHAISQGELLGPIPPEHSSKMELLSISIPSSTSTSSNCFEQEGQQKQASKAF
jgi:hypothetical protein